MALAASPLSAADPVTFYFPLVRAYGAETPVDGSIVRRSGWESKLSVFNPTEATFDVLAVAAFGNGAFLGSAPPSFVTTTVEPGSGDVVRWSLTRWPSPGVAFLELQAPPDALFSADVAWVHEFCGCTALDCVDSPQGQTPLPVYRGLFPAGARALAGPVVLGTLTESSLCASVRSTYRRRVNVTLFNAGDAVATFRISEIALHDQSAPLYEETVQVAPKEVLQINSFPVPTESTSWTRGQLSEDSVWFQVTADQPFLYYVSTIFDDPRPGALPFQVFPARLLN